MDELRGLKENVMVGRLIPAGTGYGYHQTRKGVVDTEQGEQKSTITASEVEHALSEALNLPPSEES